MATQAEVKLLQLTERINRIEVSATMAVVAEADKLRAQGVDLVDFGAGEPHFATPQHIKDAAIAAINANFTKYTPVPGTAELRDAIIHRHTVDFDSDFKREECIASTGGKHALFNTVQVLVDHGDEVIVPVPYWVTFKDVIRLCGGVPVYVATDEQQDFRLTPQMIERALTPRTKVIILNSPSNPSGAVMSPEDMTAIVRLAHERGIWVISDECYVYLNFTGRRFSVGSLREFRDRTVIIGSLSKTYSMTGWRLGYALAPAPLVSAMQKLQSQSTSNPTSIVQKAGVAALMRQADDGGHVLGAHHRARGVRGRVQDDDLGARGEGALDHSRGEREAGVLVGFHEYRRAARVAHDVLEGDPGRGRDDDLVAMVHQHLDGVEQGVFAAGGGDGLLAFVLGAEIAGVASHDGVAQLPGAAHRRVPGEVGLQGGDGGVLDVLGSIEMGLAGAEVDQVGARGAQAVGLVDHRQGGGNLDAVDSLG